MIWSVGGVVVAEVEPVVAIDPGLGGETQMDSVANDNASAGLRLGGD